CGCRVLAQAGAIGRHRRRPVARARARPRDRPVRGSAVRRGPARRRGAFTGRGSGKAGTVSAARRRSLRIGCSGWNYTSWKDEFYDGKPACLWLRQYARSFDTVEVNNTFYRLPQESAVARWVAETPPSLLFAIKSSRYLTHVTRPT